MIGAAVTVMVAAILILTILPLGWLRGPATEVLSAMAKRPVTIDRLERERTWSLSPVIRLEGMHLAQPGWVGQSDFVAINSLRVQLAALPLLRGKLVPVEADVSGLKLDLRRTADGRSNWSNDTQPNKQGSPTTIPQLRHLRIANSSLHFIDDRHHLDLDAVVAADERALTIIGRGRQRGKPLTLQMVAGPIEAIDPVSNYPFRVVVASEFVNGRATGTMDHVLDVGHLTAMVTVRGDDLAYLDDLIQAGVPATQGFALTATVRHDAPDWHLSNISGMIGRSDLAGDLTVRKLDGRSNLDAHVSADRFDFDDLSSDAQLAAAAAEERRLGKRILPATQIHLERLAWTDGTVHLSVRHLLSAHSSPFVGVDAVLKLDQRQLIVMPITARLIHGTLRESILINHRIGAPKLIVALQIKGGRIEDLFSINPARAQVAINGRIRLHGSGMTVRAALGRSDGTIDVFGQGGAMDFKVATLAAGDVVRGARSAIGGDQTLASIRCLDAHFIAQGGRLSADNLMLDTAVMRAGGSGTVDLSSEQLALTLHGRSKHPDIIQSTVPIHIGGTLSRATFDVLPVDRSPPKKALFGRVSEVVRSLKLRGDIGRSAGAPDAPCAALAQTRDIE